MNVPEDGEYAFTDASDDGSWIYLDGQLVLPNGGTHGAVERQGVLTPMTKGLHAIEVRYFDAGGGAYLKIGLRTRPNAESPVHDVELTPLLSHDKGMEALRATAALHAPS